jgi:signal transduction histidine kinase
VLKPGLLRRISSGRRALRSAGVRFAVLYAAVFGLSAIVLAVSLWYSTVGLINQQTETAIRGDAQMLARHFDQGGLPALSQTIRNRLAENINGDALYFLSDPPGNRIAGNLSRWPSGLDEAHSWYKLPVERFGSHTVALLRFYDLPGGYRLMVGRDLRTRARLGHILREGLLSALSAMLLLGIIGAVVIRSLFARSLADISETTRAISRGDLTRRVPRTRDGDEFDQLAETINEMLDRITRLMDGVRQVSNAIAHDLRTPVARARARLEDAALHAKTAEELRAAMERSTADLDNVMNVFQALLRIAEVEAGARRSAFTEIDLAPVLADMKEFYEADADERDITLIGRWDPQLLIIGDREMIQQAIANLLGNALKFSPAGGVVTLLAVGDETSVQIVVTDHGPGIPEIERPRAVERFYRAEAARNSPGSGLGLALVSAVAQLHYGLLRLEDNQPGLKAVLALPRLVAAPERPSPTRQAGENGFEGIQRDQA